MLWHDDAHEALMPQENSAAGPTRLLLVADHDELRQHIVRLLKGHVGSLRVCEAVDRREAMQLAQLRPFSAIIVDLDLAHDNAIRLAVDLQRLNSDAPLLLLSRLGDEGLIAADLPLKRATIVPRHLISTGLPNAVTRALAGDPSS
jgi:DNA-binding NarL/FixJ family response regulator